MTRRLIIGISGASGFQYGVKALQLLRAHDVETHLVVSKGAEMTRALETGYTKEEVYALADVVYSVNHIGERIASGSFKTDGMLIAPCSMRTLASVAHGFGDNLLNVLSLSKCSRSEVFFAVKVIASAVFQGFLLEVLFKGFLPDIVPITVDNVVQSSAGKVSKQDCLTVGSWRHGVDEVGKWVVSVVSKASGNAADINEIVGLIYDYRGFFVCIYIDKIYL